MRSQNTVEKRASPAARGPSSQRARQARSPAPGDSDRGGATARLCRGEVMGRRRPRGGGGRRGPSWPLGGGRARRSQRLPLHLIEARQQPVDTGEGGVLR